MLQQIHAHVPLSSAHGYQSLPTLSLGAFIGLPVAQRLLERNFHALTQAFYWLLLVYCPLKPKTLLAV